MAQKAVKKYIFVSDLVYFRPPPRWVQTKYHELISLVEGYYKIHINVSSLSGGRLRKKVERRARVQPTTTRLMLLQ